NAPGIKTDNPCPKNNNPIQIMPAIKKKKSKLFIPFFKYKNKRNQLAIIVKAAVTMIVNSYVPMVSLCLARIKATLVKPKLMTVTKILAKIIKNLPVLF